ncbi:MAG: hypothetical protein ACKVS8_12675 [Phycisphaerales bacterium]
MNTAHAPHTSPPRVRFVLQAALLALLALAACVLVGVLCARVNRTWDLTASRNHELSPQTLALLTKVAEPLELVVAAPLNEVDPGVRGRTAEVLAALAQRQPRLRVSTIDTASPAGVKELDAVFARLSERSAAQIVRSGEVIRSALEQARVLASELGKLGDDLDAVAVATAGAAELGEEAEKLRRYWASQAGAARKLSEETLARVAVGERAMSETLAPLDVPPLDDAAAAAREPFSAVGPSLAVLNKSLDDFVRLPGVPALARDRAKALAAGLAALRDSAARQQNELAALPKIPLLSVARAVQSDRAALLIGDADARAPGDTRPALLAIDIDQILPRANPAQPRAGGVDTRFRTEELVAGALAAMTTTDRPLAVLVHGAARRLGPDFASFRKLADRFDLANIELTEWAVGLDEPPPIPITGAAGPARAVVWITLGIEAGSPDSAVRMGKLAAAIGQIIGAGRNLLISLNPSNLPNMGAPDPMAEFLRPLGITADTGRVVLEQALRAPGDTAAGGKPGRLAFTDQYVRDPRSTHPIAASIAGVQTRLPWPVPLRIVDSPPPPPGVQVSPVIWVEAAPDRWTDEAWQPLRQALPAEREKLPDLPRPDGGRASALPPSGLIVAAAVERTDPAFPPDIARQRVVVIGSNGWFFDGVTRASTVVDGRAVFDAPGNLQLLESSVWWLAGRDNRLGRGAASQASPTIPDLTAAQRAALQWVLIGALPLGVLLLGVLFRAWRG